MCIISGLLVLLPKRVPLTADNMHACTSILACCPAAHSKSAAPHSTPTGRCSHTYTCARPALTSEQALDRDSAFHNRRQIVSGTLGSQIWYLLPSICALSLSDRYTVCEDRNVKSALKGAAAREEQQIDQAPHEKLAKCLGAAAIP